MKRVLGSVAFVLVVGAAGIVADSAITSCTEWQERFKQFTYLEMMKNSPVIYTFEDIERIIGERPDGCDNPEVTKDDIARFRSEGVDPNEFLDQERAAFQ